MRPSMERPGTNDAVFVASLYETLPETKLPSASLSRTVELLMVLAAMSLEKVAVTGAVKLTLVAPLSGLTPSTPRKSDPRPVA